MSEDNVSFSSFYLAMTAEDERALWALAQERFGAFGCFDFHAASFGLFAVPDDAPGFSVTWAFGAPPGWRPQVNEHGGVANVVRPTVSYGWERRGGGPLRLQPRRLKIHPGHTIETIVLREFSFGAPRDDKEGRRKIAAFRRLLPRMATNDVAVVRPTLSAPPIFKPRQRSLWIGAHAAAWARESSDRFFNHDADRSDYCFLPMDDPRSAPWEGGRPTAELLALSRALPRTIAVTKVSIGYDPNNPFVVAQPSDNENPPPPRPTRTRRPRKTAKAEE